MNEIKPSAGEEAARAALRESVEMNRNEVRLAGETISLLRSEIRCAVEDGIQAAMTEQAAERFWATGLAVLQRQATERTGKFVLGGVGILFKRILWMGLIVLALYNFGGWAAIKALWTATASRGTP